jgi:hypothetical protein
MARTQASPVPEVGKLDFLTLYRKRVPLGEGEDEVVYLRALSGPQMNDRKNYALLQSAALRRRLRDPDTMDYQARIAPLADLDDAELSQNIMLYADFAAWTEVWAEIPDDPRIPQSSVLSAPEGADSLEAEESALLSPLEEEAKRAADLDRQRKVAHDEKIEERKALVEAMSHEDRLDEAQRRTIAWEANTEYQSALQRALVALCTYRDKECRTPAWSLDQAHEISQALVEYLAEQYQEVGQISRRFLTERY